MRLWRGDVSVCVLSLMIVVVGCSSTSGPGGSGDHEPPAVSITYPPNNAVIGDTVRIRVDATDQRSVEVVEFYIDGVNEYSDESAPYEFLWDAGGEQIASTHTVFVRARDGAGNQTTSDSLTLHFKWIALIEDADEAWSRDLASVCVRSTAATLEFRVETNGSWSDPHSWGSGINVGIFLDVDQSQGTGLSEWTGWSYAPNDIGADYVGVVGMEGDSLWVWSNADTLWEFYRPFEYLDLPDAGSSFEVGVALVDLGLPSVVDVVVSNITYSDTTAYWDWAPDAGHVAYRVDGLYIGGGQPPSGKGPRHARDRQVGPGFFHGGR